MEKTGPKVRPIGRLPQASVRSRRRSPGARWGQGGRVCQRHSQERPQLASECLWWVTLAWMAWPKSRPKSRGPTEPGPTKGPGACPPPRTTCCALLGPVPAAGPLRAQDPSGLAAWSLRGGCAGAGGCGGARPMAPLPPGLLLRMGAHPAPWGAVVSGAGRPRAHRPVSRTVPQQTEGFRKRWFTLDDRRLMYFKDPLVGGLRDPGAEWGAAGRAGAPSAQPVPAAGCLRPRGGLHRQPGEWLHGAGQAPAVHPGPPLAARHHHCDTGAQVPAGLRDGGGAARVAGDLPAGGGQAHAAPGVRR